MRGRDGFKIYRHISKEKITKTSIYVLINHILSIQLLHSFYWLKKKKVILTVDWEKTNNQRLKKKKKKKKKTKAGLKWEFIPISNPGWRISRGDGTLFIKAGCLAALHCKIHYWARVEIYKQKINRSSKCLLISPVDTYCILCFSFNHWSLTSCP